MFHRMTGSAHWADTRWVRYADDLVVVARERGERLSTLFEMIQEGCMGLEMNQEKARGGTLKEKGVSSYRHVYDLGLLPLK